MYQGKTFIISGPSGVGKNTLLNAVVARSEHVRYSISATSRAMRPGEVDGKSYYFYASGALAVNTTINGYKVGADGAWVQ